MDAAGWWWVSFNENVRQTSVVVAPRQGIKLIGHQSDQYLPAASQVLRNFGLIGPGVLLRLTPGFMLPTARAEFSIRQKRRGEYHDQHQREGAGERLSPMSLVLVLVLARNGTLVQPDHMRVGLHLIESGMYWNMESIVEGIVIRIVDLWCRLHSLLLLANVR